MTGPAPRRRLPLWLPAAGAAVGIALLAMRLATAPLDQTSPYLAVLVVAAAATIGVFTARALLRRHRMRVATDDYPRSLVFPIVGGVDTSAATRWLAAQLGDPRLALRPERDAIVALDASGLRLRQGRTTSAPIPAGMLSVLPLTTVRAGMRRVDALALGVTVGDVVAPLPLVPARSGIVGTGALSDAELLDVSARIRDALPGSPGMPERQG